MLPEKGVTLESSKGFWPDDIEKFIDILLDYMLKELGSLATLTLCVLKQCLK